jgi:hypothetical protein
MPSGQRGRSQADDRQPVELLDPRPEAHEALDVGHHLDVDRGAVQAGQNPLEVRQALERQREEDLVDAPRRYDLRDLVPMTEDGSPSDERVDPRRLVGHEAAHLSPSSGCRCMRSRTAWASFAVADDEDVPEVVAPPPRLAEDLAQGGALEHEEPLAST